MSHDIKELLKAATQDKPRSQDVNKSITPDLIQLSVGDIFGKVYYSQPIGTKEQLMLRAMIGLAAERTGFGHRRIMNEVKSFVNVNSINRLDLGEYERAIDYLVARCE